MSVKGWGERELPEGYEWSELHGGLVRHVEDVNRLFSEESIEDVLRVFAPDQIEEEPSPCGDKWLGWTCSLTQRHPRWPHLTQSIYGGGGVAWLHGEDETNTLSLPAPAVADAPWFDGGDE